MSSEARIQAFSLTFLSLQCGMGAYEDRKYLAWVNPANSNASLQSDGHNGYSHDHGNCVSSCPTKGQTFCASMGLMTGKCNYVGWNSKSRLYRCEVYCALP